MKNTIFSLIAGLFLFVGATSALAGGTTTKEVCSTNQYGETTCTTTTENGEVVVHDPVDAAIGDINPALLSVVLFGGAYLAHKASVSLK